MRLNKSMKVEINDKEYDVKVATTSDEMSKGLQNVKELPEDEGMLFIFEEPQTVGFWMKDTEIPLDIIFIDEDLEVLSIYKGQPNNQDIVEEDNVKYVLELNINSGVSVGDEVELEDEDDNEIGKMIVLTSNGESQMELEGGERIFSRKKYKNINQTSKKADVSKSDSDYKRLGKKHV